MDPNSLVRWPVSPCTISCGRHREVLTPWTTCTSLHVFEDSAGLPRQCAGAARRQV